MSFKASKRVGGRNGARLNVGKKSASVSLGAPGKRLTVGTRGVRATLGAPGTGVSYTTKLTTSEHHRGTSHSPQLPAATPQVAAWHNRPGGITFWLIVFFPLGLYLMWTAAPWRKDTKWAISGIYFWPIWTYFARHWQWPWRIALALGLMVAFVATASPAGGVCALIGIGGLIWALHSRQADEQPAVALDTTHADQLLQACDDLICDLERTVMIDLLPAFSDMKMAYHRALERRAEGAERLRQACQPADVHIAENTLAEALWELREIHDSQAPRA